MVRALAMVAEVVHGAPYRFSDRARFSFAHGGKDRHPFPVPLIVHDETIRALKIAVQEAKLGRDEKLGALWRLDEQDRLLEKHATGPSVPELIAEERIRASRGCAERGSDEKLTSRPIPAGGPTGEPQPKIHRP
jgi:hypothetical protein